MDTVDAGKALAELNELEEKVREAEDKVKRAAVQPLSQLTQDFQLPDQKDAQRWELGRLVT